ncbi:MAG: glycosyltransferase family 4 protein [Fibrobacterota bacterium]|nr:glycosyltransferase family 4 protein [Fibrobacterota bacterium]
MEVIFIDSEPQDAAGGGIRTYIRLAMRTCREAGHSARVYTHNPNAYPGENVTPIGRRPWLRRPVCGVAYRLLYHENVLWEHAYWLNSELEAGDAPGRVYEFCDFQGYGFFALRNKVLRGRTMVRVHTPSFLVPAPAGRCRERLSARLGAWREKDCLRRAKHITVPSAEFVKEKLPWLRNWAHVPNPMPPETDAEEIASRYASASLPNAFDPSRQPAGDSAATIPERFSGDGSGWSPAPEDPAEMAERNAPRPTRILPDRFLYLGRLEERKGVLVLVRAFARLAAERPYAYLTLAGGTTTGPYAAAIRYLVESQPAHIRARILFEGPCPPEKRGELFARFTALVAPSLWENSPYVYFEGMAAGLSCIGSATGEMKAVAAVTGALTARPGDENDWLRALRAHCLGSDRGALPAQTAYLRESRRTIPGLLLAAWSRVASEPKAGGA